MTPISIKKINVRQLKMTLKNPFTTSFGTLQEKTFFIIEAIDADGNCGYGESVAFDSPWYTEETVQTNAHIIEDFLIPILSEHDISHPDDVSPLFSPIKGNNMAKAAVEGAVWDLYAKQQNIPLAKALGGERSEEHTSELKSRGQLVSRLRLSLLSFSLSLHYALPISHISSKTS